MEQKRTSLPLCGRFSRSLPSPLTPCVSCPYGTGGHCLGEVDDVPRDEWTRDEGTRNIAGRRGAEAQEGNGSSLECCTSITELWEMFLALSRAQMRSLFLRQPCTSLLESLHLGLRGIERGGWGWVGEGHGA